MFDSGFFDSVPSNELSRAVPDDVDCEWLLSTVRGLCHDSDQDWRFAQIRDELEARGFISRPLSPIPRSGSPFAQVYRSLGEIGEGGYGKVYRVRNLIDRQQYALKVIQLERNEVGPAMREVQCLAALNSPRILRYYSSWLEEGSTDQEMSLFIQTEFVSGSTLRDVLDSRADVDVDFSKHVARELTQALIDIHSAGIIHRDFTPANIIIKPDGSVKVIDFGISSWRKNSDTLEDEPPQEAGSLPERFMNPIDEFCLSQVEKANTWREVGTPMYSSPRQLCGHKATAGDDIYSFGVTMIELFSAFRTHMEKAKVIGELKKGQIAKEFAAKWPKLAALAKRMTDSDPDKRPSASEIAESGLFEPDNTDL